MMAQQFQVLRCFSCSVFQGQQVKKNKKWICKMCGEKQSILKVYGQGTASDCRRHIQKLNLLQGEAEEPSGEELRSAEELVERGDENTLTWKNNLEWQERKDNFVSRWTKYLGEQKEKPEEEDEDEEAKLCTEKQAYFLKTKRAKHPRRKHTTCLGNTDSQEPVKKRVSKFAEDIPRVEGKRSSATSGEKSCEPATCKTWMSTTVEGHPVCKQDKDPDARHNGLSKWRKFLSCDATCKSDSSAVLMQEEQNTSIPLARAQQVFATEYVKKDVHSPALSTPYCIGIHPGESFSVPSVTASATVNSQNLAKSLFSTGEDFDDDI